MLRLPPRSTLLPYATLFRLGSGADLPIGDFCDISAGVLIWIHGTELRCVSLGSIPVNKAPVSVGDGTYLGSQSIILPGVEIGSCCIVGANSFVNTDIPDRSVMAGSPEIGRAHV